MRSFILRMGLLCPPYFKYSKEKKCIWLLEFFVQASEAALYKYGPNQINFPGLCQNVTLKHIISSVLSLSVILSYSIPPLCVYYDMICPVHINCHVVFTGVT